MKQMTLRRKLIAIIAAMVLATSCPIIAMADEDYSSSSTESDASETTSKMTSEDWAELQSQAAEELSSQNAANNGAVTNKDNSKGGSFSDFKDGKYVGNGEWLLVIGILLIVVGAAGIGFVVFMMVKRKKALSKKKVYPTNTAKEPQNKNNGNGSSGRRIAPKK